MAGEKVFWSWLRPKLGTLIGYHHQRIEDSITPGIPDLNFCYRGREFWLELKSLTAWPSRISTPIHFERYTMEQRNWLRDRWRAGGRSFLLLRVATPGVVLAWTGEAAHSGVEGGTKAQLMASSCGMWYGVDFTAGQFLRDLERARTG